MGTTTYRRVNYNYLLRLAERLRALGVEITEIPTFVLEQTWDQIREHIQDAYRFDYCVRCKLPLAKEDASSLYKNMCHDHAEAFQEVWSNRRDRRLMHIDGRLASILEESGNKKRQSPMVEHIIDDVKRRMREKEQQAIQQAESLVASNPEPTTPKRFTGVALDMEKLFNRTKNKG